jgi:hypothetical protein
MSAGFFRVSIIIKPPRARASKVVTLLVPDNLLEETDGNEFRRKRAEETVATSFATLYVQVVRAEEQRATRRRKV